jgi:hypothetical protein
MTAKFAKQAKTAQALNKQRSISKSVLESTLLIEYTDAPVIPCKAGKTFTKGRVTVREGQKFFLVRSSKFVNRYYVVCWSEQVLGWQCSCYCVCSKSEHCLIVNEWIVNHVVAPKKAAPHVEEKREDVAGVTRPYTAEEYKQLHKRNQAWQIEQKCIERGKVAIARAAVEAQCDVAERKIA